MNDINWGGRVVGSNNLAFAAQLVDGTPVSFTVPLYAGYYAFHVAAAFADSWNFNVPNPAYFAIADGNAVRFPNIPGGVFSPNTRTFNGTLLNDNGTVLTIPGFPQLRARAAEAYY